MKLADRLQQVAVMGNERGLAGQVEASGRLKLLDPAAIHARIVATDVGKEDLLSQWSGFKLVGTSLLQVQHPRPVTLLMTTHAYDQMASRLGVPPAYLRKCPLGGPAGQQDQLEYWRDHIDDREILLRTQMSLSKPEYGGVLYKEPVNLGTEQTPDFHYYGLHIGDSEVGTRAFTVDFMLYRLTCFNGSMYKVDGGHLMHQKHIHVDFPGMRREFANTIEQAVQFKDVLFGAIDAAKSETVTDPHSALRRLAKFYKFQGDFADKIVKAYEQEPIPTRFGLSQALTRAARELNINQRTHVETAAGEYLMQAA